MKRRLMLLVFLITPMLLPALPPSSASHSIRIIIRRPQVFNIEQVRDFPSSRLQIDGEAGANRVYNLKWSPNITEKRITVSASSQAQGTNRLLIEDKKEIELTASHMDISAELGQFDGGCNFQCLGQADEVQSVQLVYTLTDK